MAMHPPPYLEISAAEQNQNNREIYRQKYENFRHFDKLRWQMPGIALAIGAGVVAVAVRQGTPPPYVPVILVLMGLGTSVCAYAMHRIRFRLEENREALRKVGLQIGDTHVHGPEARSATRALELFLWCVAICAGLAAIAIIWRYGVVFVDVKP